MGRALNLTNRKTFRIDIIGNTKGSWQGIIYCPQLNETRSFRSTLELLKLMDSVIEQDQGAGSS